MGFSMASNTTTSWRLPSPHPRSVARRARHLAKAPSRHHLSDSWNSPRRVWLNMLTSYIYIPYIYPYLTRCLSFYLSDVSGINMYNCRCLSLFIYQLSKLYKNKQKLGVPRFSTSAVYISEYIWCLWYLNVHGIYLYLSDVYIRQVYKW